MKTLKLRITGLVQGVSFRRESKKIADELGVKGLVKNENDGSVSIIAQGEENGLNYFVERIKKNIGKSKVEEIKVEELVDDRKFNSFEIVWNKTAFWEVSK